MRKIKFISCALASVMILTSSGFAMDVIVTIEKLPQEFQSSAFNIVFPHIGTQWHAALNRVDTQQSIAVSLYANLNNIEIQRLQIGKKEVIPCSPTRYKSRTPLKVVLSHKTYRCLPYDGLFCTVTETVQR